MIYLEDVEFMQLYIQKQDKDLVFLLFYFMFMTEFRLESYSVWTEIGQGLGANHSKLI